MIQPIELKIDLPIELSNGVISSTHKVWDTLVASYEGNIQKCKSLVRKCPELAYAQYNYTPPIHFAVREGHVDLLKYLLDLGAHDPAYRIYPFLDTLQTISNDRQFNEITELLQAYQNDPSRCKFKGDNGAIQYQRTEAQTTLQKALNNGNIDEAKQILNVHPEFAKDHFFFWSEGIMSIPAQHRNYKLLDMLMSFGATVPPILKWAQEYYFKYYDAAAFMMEHGMNPNVMSWHHVTLLHDMAQKGDLQKAELLIRHGAEINPIEEEYQSTPLGMAVRWGHEDMVKYLLREGADPNKSGAAWSTPLAWSRKKNYPAITEILLKSGAVDP